MRYNVVYFYVIMGYEGQEIKISIKTCVFSFLYFFVYTILISGRTLEL